MLSLGSFVLDDLLQSPAELISTNASVPMPDIGQNHQAWNHFLNARGSEEAEIRLFVEANENQIRLFAEWLALQRRKMSKFT